MAWATPRTRRLQRTAFLLCGDWHTSEDLVQEALTKTALHWTRIAGRGDPDAYIRTVLVNAARTRWRRRSVSNERPTGDDAPWDRVAVNDGADERADRELLLTALSALPERQRTAVVLRYFEQLTEAETAAAMDCSTGTVKSQTHRALKSLNRLLTVEADTC